jgi:hypothetical protein
VSTTLTRPVVESGSHRVGLRLDPVRHRRRPALAVGSLALVVACVAVFTSVYAKAGDQLSVVGVAVAVPQGQVVKADDLTVVRIAASSGLSTVPADEASVVVGRRAAENLEPGTLLTTEELVVSYSPPAGESIVGVAAKEGQYPASGVEPGETVDVILTGAPGQEDSVAVDPETTSDQSGAGATATPGEATVTAGTVLVPDATVLEAAPSPASSGSDAVDVSLLMPSTLAPLVASASAADQVALVVVSPGP